MHTTSASLLEQLRRPAAQEAWSRFVKLYTPLLYHWAGRLGLAEPDAADLVQDVLLCLVRRLPEFTYDPHRSFRAWLRTVMLNTWRNRARRPTAPQATDAALAALAGPDVGDEHAEAEYRDYLVGRALQVMRSQFQPATWKAFYEHMVAGRPAREVARQLGIRVESVYAAKSRVLRRLRQELAGLLDEF